MSPCASAARTKFNSDCPKDCSNDGTDTSVPQCTGGQGEYGVKCTKTDACKKLLTDGLNKTEIECSSAAFQLSVRSFVDNALQKTYDSCGGSGVTPLYKVANVSTPCDSSLHKFSSILPKKCAKDCNNGNSTPGGLQVCAPGQDEYGVKCSADNKCVDFLQTLTLQDYQCYYETYPQYLSPGTNEVFSAVLYHQHILSSCGGDRWTSSVLASVNETLAATTVANLTSEKISMMVYSACGKDCCDAQDFESSEQRKKICEGKHALPMCPGGGTPFGKTCSASAACRGTIKGLTDDVLKATDDPDGQMKKMLVSHFATHSPCVGGSENFNLSDAYVSSLVYGRDRLSSHNTCKFTRLN